MVKFKELAGTPLGILANPGLQLPNCSMFMLGASLPF